MKNSKGPPFVLACAIVYVAVMGVSNHIVYRYFHASYTGDGYAKAMLPFLALLAVGSLACLHAGRNRLRPSWEGAGGCPSSLSASCLS